MSSYKERCNNSCKICSLDPNYCLNCNKTSNYPVYDPSTGRCIPKNPALCGQGIPKNIMKVNRFYIDEASLECKLCSELCKTCEDTPTKCT